MSGSDSSSSTTSASIPPELMPLAALYTSQAENIASTPFQYYTDPRYADLNQTQNLGIGMVQDRALTGSETMDAAEGSLNQFIAGGQTNPYLDQMVANAQSSVAEGFNTMTKPQIESSMINSGSFGNSGLQQTMAQQQQAAVDTMGQIATDMYGNAYATDQANQLSAIGMAPTFGNAAYEDAAQLMAVGDIQQQQDQNQLDFNYDQYLAAQEYPFQQISATGGVLGQGMGTSTTASGGGK